MDKRSVKYLHADIGNQAITGDHGKHSEAQVPSEKKRMRRGW
jgi:hypothetical protein